MGALTLAGEQRAPPPTVAAPQAQLPLEQEHEGRVVSRTPHPLSSLRRPHEPWGRRGDELRPANSPTWRAKCRGAANHGRVAEGTRPSPEGVYSGVS